MAVTTIDGLTMPAPGASVLRAVMNDHWRAIVADYLALPLAEHPARFGVPALVRELVGEEPRLVVRVLRTPMIAGLIGATRRLAPHEAALRDRLLVELELAVLVELASRGGLARRVEVELPQSAILRSTASRRALEVPGGSRIAFVRGGVEDAVTGTVLGGSRAFFPIEEPFLLATSDSNPLLSVSAHPERDGNSVDLGGRPVEEWTSKLGEAFAILHEHAPSTHEEMRLALELIVPVGFAEERHFSVSYRDSVGALYMTLTSNVMTLAEALIHEFQHNKLNAVLHSDPLLENGTEASFASPVRPDPRPLLGVLMAVHAFLPVARLYRDMTRAGHSFSKGRDWEKRFHEIASANREAADTVLAHAKPTRLGRGLLAEIERWTAELGTLRG